MATILDQKTSSNQQAIADDGSSSDEEKDMPKEKVQGYCKEKYKFKIGNTNDLILKIRSTDIIGSFFKQSDPQWAGLSNLFRSL